MQRRRLAILAALASAGPRGVPRDRLLSLFWPERDTSAARHALEQAIYTLRRELGAEAVEGVDPVCLGATLSYDAAGFDEAVSDANWDAALELYGGPFLDGLHVTDAPAFEEWADQERHRLAIAYRRALGKAATHLEAEGNHREAEALWRRYSSEDPLAPDGVKGQARCLVALGQHARANAMVQGWERLVRLELRLEPDPGVRSVLASPTPGPRQTTTDPPGPGQKEPAAGIEGREPVPLTARRSPSRVHLFAVLAVVLTIALGLGIRGFKPSPDPAFTGDFVLLPFEVVPGDSAMHAVAGALPGMIAAQVRDPEETLVPVEAVRAAMEDEERGGWQDLETVAARFGASRILGGQLSGGVTGVAVTTTISGRSGRQIAAATAVGSLDSLGPLAHRLTIGLLADLSGGRLTSAGDVPLPVLQHYAWARNALGRSQYHRATAHLRRTLALDSTFAPAALLLRQITAETDGTDEARASRLAWTYRTRLARDDRDLIESLLGPTFPAQTSIRDQLQRVRRHTALHLHHAEGWYALGQVLYSHGHALGVPDPWGETRSAWERALSLDSIAAEPAMRGLEEMAAITGDTALLSRIGGGAPTAGDQVYASWLRAFTARDTLALAAIRPSLVELDTLQLLDVRALGLRAAFDLASVELVTRTWAEKVTSAPQRSDAAVYLHAVAIIRGRPAEAARVSETMLSEWAPGDRQAAAAVRAAWDAEDLGVGADAARDLMAKSLPLSADDGTRASQLYRRCAAEQYRVAIGTMATARETARMFRERAPLEPAWLPPLLEGCALYLEGMAAADRGDPQTVRIAEALDAWQRDIPSGNWVFPAILATGRLWIAAGDWARASEAFERRSPKQVRYLPMTLRLAGDAAARAGNRKAAIQAYRRYLALRSDPEPPLQAEADYVRRELVKLESPGDAPEGAVLK